MRRSTLSILLFCICTGVISRNVVSRSVYRGASPALFLCFHLGTDSMKTCLFDADCVCPDGPYVLRVMFLSTGHESHAIVGHPPPHNHAHTTTIIIIILTSSTHHYHHPPHTTILHHACMHHHLPPLCHPAVIVHMPPIVACMCGVLRSISEVSCRCFGLLSINKWTSSIKLCKALRCTCLRPAAMQEQSEQRRLAGAAGA